MSFRLKTIIGIALIEVILLTVLIVSGIYYLRASNAAQVKGRATTTARLLATMTSDPVVTMDLATLDALISESLRNPGIVYVRVKNRNDVVLSAGGDVSALSAPFKADESVENVTDGRFDVIQEISIAGTPFGTVELGIETLSLAETMAKATRWMLVVAGIEIVLVAVFGYMLGNVLTGKLVLLQRGARRVASGELGYQIAVDGSDELADTASSFNAMSSSLAAMARYMREAQAAAEAGRDRAESVLHDAISSLSEGVLVLDGDDNVLHVNDAFAAIHTCVPELSMASTLTDVSERLAAHVVREADGMARIDEIFEKAQPGQREARPRIGAPTPGTQWTSRFDDGRIVFYSCRDMAGGGHVIVGSDVSEIFETQRRSRQLEHELMQSQKLEALGTLAGGIAHELNTPIQFIGDNLNFIGEAGNDLIAVTEAHAKLLAALSEGGADPAAIAEYRDDLAARDVDFLRDELPTAVSQSVDGIRHMAEIVRAMKEFSHPSVKEKAPVDVNKVAERAALVGKNEWKYAATLDLKLDAGIERAYAVEGELNQVLLNLIVNAAHATAAANREQGHIVVRTWQTGDTIHISVADNGTGIPEEIRDRVFEPFFTTKDVGKGTGQGLALCHEFIVSRQKGILRFDTETGVGTTFFVELPVARSERA